MSARKKKDAIHYFMIRVTAEEHQLITDASSHAGHRHVSTYIRSVILADGRRELNAPKG